MLIDTHAHLNIEPLYDNWPEVLKQAVVAGVEKLVVPGSSLTTCERGVEIANQEERVMAAVGIHPEHLEEETDWDELMEKLEKLAQSPKVVAIGECGLDYHYTQENQEQQKKLFRLQVDLAKKLNLPLIIHTREEAAIEDAKNIIQDFNHCVYHCFSGKADPGVFVGIGGTITYKGNDQLREVVSRIPLERIILETDAPWLAPDPRRGTINVPANVTITALKLAELKQLPVSQIIEQTGKNATSLFLRKS